MVYQGIYLKKKQKAKWKGRMLRERKIINVNKNLGFCSYRFYVSIYRHAQEYILVKRR